MSNNFFNRSIFFILLPIFFIHTSCIALPEKDRASDSLTPTNGLRVASLALTGYNYTNRPIDGFTVDGLGGGNVRVSGEYSGGGGDVCCVSYVIGAKARTIKVRWQKSACWPGNESIENIRFRHRPKYIYEEISVQIDKRIPHDPSFLEIHFYPDGHVEAAITAKQSIPRLKLTQGREEKTDFPPCGNENEK